MDTLPSTTGPDHPDLILSLVPLNKIARKTFKRDVNWRHYHRCASTKISKEPVVRKDERETTPEREIPREKHAQWQDESTIELSFAQPPRHPPSGYVFGSDPDVCDIFLGSRASGVSSIMFSIKYIKEGLLVLHSQSEINKIEVSYEPSEHAEQRSEYVWVLFPEKENITVTLVNELVFKIRFPDHGEGVASYQEARDTFINDPVNGCLEISQLNRNIHHNNEDDCAAIVPFNEKIYTRFGKLGAGSFGYVHEVAEASTAARFAMKTLFPGHVRYEEWRVARATLKREAATLAGLVHRRIVQYYGVFKESDSLCMVMEMLPHGDLQTLLNQAGPQGLSNAQASVVLWQGLEALGYLHEKNITHRDLKPNNIMVVAQSPLLKFKLVDFGLSHAPTRGQTPISKMKTFCGTYEFLAPEQWIEGIYTNKVDIWALAVVVMYCLDIRSGAAFSMADAMEWCNNLITAIETAGKERVPANIRKQLVNILSHHMLQLEADNRRSAQELLQLYDGFFSLLQQMETTVESQDPQLPLEFDPGLREQIDNLNDGLENHCMWQNVGRGTRGDCGNYLDPDSWSAYKNRRALDQPRYDLDAVHNQSDLFGEEDQSQTPAGEKDQPLDLFHDQNGTLRDWHTQSGLAKAGPSQKHSRQASSSSEAPTEISSKKRRM